jgi:hypothetical protein
VRNAAQRKERISHDDDDEKMRINILAKGGEREIKTNNVEIFEKHDCGYFLCMDPFWALAAELSVSCYLPFKHLGLNFRSFSACLPACLTRASEEMKRRNN